MDLAEADRAIRALLHDELGCRPGTISSDADLFRDLGIDGADAVDFLDAVEREFDVDLSEMDRRRHFGPERAFTPLALLSPSWWTWRRERIPVTVHDLARAVVAGRWLTGERKSRTARNSPPR